MDRDEDIAAALPRPPLPEPAARAAALTAAMQRYDAARAERPAVRTQPARRHRDWRAVFLRPQYAALAGIAAVFVISLPRPETAVPAPVVMSEAAPPPPSLREVAPAAPAPAEPKLPAAPLPPPAEADTAPPAVSPAPAVAAPQPVIIVQSVAPAAARSRQEDAEEAAPAPPPPPPPAPAARPAPAGPALDARAGADGDFVVTGSRRSVAAVPEMRGWTDCTLDDPARSPAACGNDLDAAAAGPRGRAAALLADGLVLGWQGNLDRAIETFGLAIRLEPRAPLPYLNRGIAFQRRRDFARAAADFDLAVRYGRSDARVFYYRSLSRRDRGDASGAARDLDRATQLGRRTGAPE